MIQSGEDKYKAALKTLWQCCFPDDTETFTAFYFDEIYKNEETLMYLENNRPVAALQIIPYSIKIEKTIRRGAYLSGVMTHPACRNKGYMSQLLYKSFDEMEKKGYDYAFLIPQQEWLVQVYAKYGFQLGARCTENGARKTVHGARCETSTLSRYDTVHHFPCTLYQTYSRFLQERENVVLKNEIQFDRIIRDFFDEKGILFANEQGIAFTKRDSDKIILKEFLYQTEAVREAFLQEIRQYYRVDVILLPDENKGMIKRINPGAEAITGLYLGMMLD